MRRPTFTTLALAGMLIFATPTTVTATAPAASPETMRAAAPVSPSRASDAKPGQVLFGQRASLTATNRAPGMPTSAEPGRQLVSATVRIDVHPTLEHIDAQLELAGEPVGALQDMVTIGLGRFDGSTCVVSHSHSDYVFTGRGTSQSVVGNTGSRSADFGERPAQPWNCVVALIDAAGDPSLVYDAFVGGLQNTYEKPKPKIANVQLLGKKMKKLELARGTWTGLDVEVVNKGKVQANGLKVGGSGKALKVRGGRIATLLPGERATARIQVKPTGQSKSLALVAKAPGVRASDKIATRAVAPPPRPRAGKWRSKGGVVKFTVRGGKISGFRVQTRTRCGAPGEIPSYTNNTYDFPRTKVPRNGILEGAQRGKNDVWEWSARLQMRLSGGKATQGRFTFYNTAGNCSASETFTARRSGK